jgi:hypothetical protein
MSLNTSDTKYDRIIESYLNHLFIFDFIKIGDFDNCFCRIRRIIQLLNNKKLFIGYNFKPEYRIIEKDRGLLLPHGNFNYFNHISFSNTLEQCCICNEIPTNLYENKLSFCKCTEATKYCIDCIGNINEGNAKKCCFCNVEYGINIY